MYGRWKACVKARTWSFAQRRTPFALVIDEAQHLYRAVDMLETIHDFGDKHEAASESENLSSSLRM